MASRKLLSSSRHSCVACTAPPPPPPGHCADTCWLGFQGACVPWTHRPLLCLTCCSWATLFLDPQTLALPYLRLTGFTFFWTDRPPLRLTCVSRDFLSLDQDPCSALSPFSSFSASASCLSLSAHRGKDARSAANQLHARLLPGACPCLGMMDYFRREARPAGNLAACLSCAHMLSCNSVHRGSTCRSLHVSVWRSWTNSGPPPCFPLAGNQGEQLRLLMSAQLRLCALSKHTHRSLGVSVWRTHVQSQGRLLYP